MLHRFGFCQDSVLTCPVDFMSKLGDERFDRCSEVSFWYLSLCRFAGLCLPVCLQRPDTQISPLGLFLPSPLFPSRDPSVGSRCLSPCLSSAQISTLALFPSSPLSLERPYIGSLLPVSPSIFRDLLLRSLLLIFSSLPLSLSRNPYVGSPISVSPSVFTDVIIILIPM